MRRPWMVVMLAACGLAAVVTGAAADVVAGSDTGGRPLSAVLLGANEVPPGDPDGSGFAAVTLNQGEGLVCWEISYTDIVEPFAAHIHSAPAGVNGPVVVPLDPIAGGCRSADPDLIKAIRQNPGGYYVNIHNAEFPAGAIRGQLSK